MLKFAPLALALVLTVPAHAMEETDGFCTMDVLGLERSPKVADSVDQSFLDNALELATQHYNDYMYVEEGYEIEVYSASLRYIEGGSVSKKLGAIVALHMNADEDVVTYYYTRGFDGQALLQMFLHDQQSATANWTCEN